MTTPLEHEPRRQVSSSPSTATLTEPNMVYKTAKIYNRRDSFCPVVFGEIKGVKFAFLLDTGADVSSLSLKLVTKLGFAKEDLLPPYPYSSDYVLGYLVLPFKIGSFEHELEFEVVDIKRNLLGLDVLKKFCCVIDLPKGVLTFRDYVDGDDSTPMTTANVNGKDVQVVIDTGSEVDIRGTHAQAKDLNLTLTKAYDFELTGAGYVESIEHLAEDVCVKAFGEEMELEFLVVESSLT